MIALFYLQPSLSALLVYRTRNRTGQCGDPHCWLVIRPDHTILN